MVSGVFIVNSPDLDILHQHSELLLYRIYHDNLPSPQQVINDFDEEYKRQLPETRLPILNIKGLNYIYIRPGNDVIFMIVDRNNLDVTLSIFFLDNFQKLLRHYLQPQDRSIRFDRDLIIDNIYFIYELLDECMDMGIIQMTDYNILKEYIKIVPNWPKSHDDNNDTSSDDEPPNDDKAPSKAKNSKPDMSQIKSTHNQAVKADINELEKNINSSILRASILSINWRPKGIFYAKNEIYVDIVENCDFSYDLQHNFILRNEVFGDCNVRCYLSGMPLCTIGFNENKISKIENENVKELTDIRVDNQLQLQDDDNLDEEITQESSQPKIRKHIPFTNIQFHQCVQLDSIYNYNLMKFIPPDDSFVLMSYHVEQQRQKRKLPLFMIKPTYRINKAASKLQVLITLSTQFKKRLHCKNLVIRIPINPKIFDVMIDDITDLKYKSEMGDVSFQVDSSELVWSIPSIHGNATSIKMMTELSISNVESVTLNDINYALQNKKYQGQDEEEEDDNQEAQDELDRYYGVNGAKSSVLEEIKKNLRQIKSFNHIQLKFNIPMLSYTGLKLNYLKVEEDEMKYTCFPWVRYVTRTDSSNSNYIYNFKLGLNCFNFQL